jgi:2-polyprenyl-6-methoxyphenol hydroxylase-like FAD-dependent oxidoreductase
MQSDVVFFEQWISMASRLRAADLHSRFGHAVVVGGSMAGLLAARVLADHFERVTLVERDLLPDTPDYRVGVPQARHAHVLLTRGQIILEQLFPGIQHQLVDAGGIEFDVARDVAWLTPAGWGVRYPSGLIGVSTTRALLEWTVRRCLREHPEVRIRDGVVVRGLVRSADGSAVNGVRLGGEPDTTIPADLVVDATGRGSRLPEWLAWLRFPRPPETTIDASLGYASRVLRLSGSTRLDGVGVFVQSAPPEHPRGGALFPIEGNRWLVSLFGGDGQYPPTDEAGFLEFARALRTPIIAQAIASAEPLSEIVATRATANRRRYYEKLSGLPDGVIAVGDSVCAFNPVYAQGMSVAAIGAEVLDLSLWALRARARAGLVGFGRKFQRRMARVIETPWSLATGEDYRYPRVKGPRPHWSVRLMHTYVDRLVVASTESPSVRARLMQVLGLVRPASLLFNPAMLLSALRQRALGSVAPTSRPPRPSREFRVSGAVASPASR